MLSTDVKKKLKANKTLVKKLDKAEKVHEKDTERLQSDLNKSKATLIDQEESFKEDLNEIDVEREFDSGSKVRLRNNEDGTLYVRITSNANGDDVHLEMDELEEMIEVLNELVNLK